MIILDFLSGLTTLASLQLWAVTPDNEVSPFSNSNNHIQVKNLASFNEKNGENQKLIYLFMSMF